MIELLKYFRILFMSTKISRERLKAFTEDHIQRLTANNPGGIFTVILTNVTNAYNSYYGDLASEAINLAVQEGKTVAMNDSRAAAEKNISSNEKLIAYTYRNNLPLYEEFYPLGISEYNNADLSTFETIGLRYRGVLASHSGDFPAAFIAEYNLVYGTFVTNRQQQSAAKGNVASERSDLATTRPALALQLTTNLLTIALQFVGDESKADVYFDQAILDAAFREGERRIVSEINPAETQNIFDNVTQADVRITIKSTGEGPLNFGFRNAAGIAIPSGEHTIDAGQEVSFNAAELGWTSDNKFLNVTNNGPLAGSYIAEKN